MLRELALAVGIIVLAACAPRTPAASIHSALVDGEVYSCRTLAESLRWREVWCAQRRFFVYRNTEAFAYVRRESPNAWQRHTYLQPLGAAARSVLDARANAGTLREHGAPPIGTFVLRGSWPSAPANDEAFGSIPIGDTRLDMTVEDGREIGLLSDRKGPTVLVIGDKACAGCKILQRRFPAALARLRRYSGTLSYLVGRDPAGAARELAASGSHNDVDLIYDSALSVEAALAVRSMPATYFVTPGGRVQTLFVGSMNEALMSTYLDKLLG